MRTAWARVTVVVFVAVSILVSFGQTSIVSQTSQNDPVPKDAIPTFDAPLPWHLVDIDWQEFHENERQSDPFALDRLEIDVSILTEVPKDSPYFICPFYGFLNEHSFYAALTTARHHTDLNKIDSKPIIKQEKSAIFRRWLDLDHSAIMPAVADGQCVGRWEDNFISCETPYQWTKGKYTLELIGMHTELVRGRAHRWVALFMYRHDDKSRTFVGALRFPTEKFMILRQIFASFVEVYERRTKPEEPLIIPAFRVAFGNIRMNGVPYNPLGVVAYYPKNVPQIALAKMAKEHLAEFPEDRTLLPQSDMTVVVLVESKQHRRMDDHVIIYERKDPALIPVILRRPKLESFLKDPFRRLSGDHFSPKLSSRTKP